VVLRPQSAAVAGCAPDNSRFAGHVGSLWQSGFSSGVGITPQETGTIPGADSQRKVNQAWRSFIATGR